MFLWISYAMLYNLNQYGGGEAPTHALHCHTRLDLPALPCWDIPLLTCHLACWPPSHPWQHSLALKCTSAWLHRMLRLLSQHEAMPVWPFRGCCAAEDGFNILEVVPLRGMALYPAPHQL